MRRTFLLPGLALAALMTVSAPAAEISAAVAANFTKPAEELGKAFTARTGETVAFGLHLFEVLHCPGHAPGHVVFYDRAAHFAHVGDVLFSGSIGRTDLPGGDHSALIASIKEKLLPLGDDIGFICGHGPGGGFGEERRTNPFLV